MIVPAALLLHVENGAWHLDLVLGAGCPCPTFRLEQRETLWQWRALAPHRRRYLDYQGPVGCDRGRVERLWTGRLDLRSTGGGRLIRTLSGDCGFPWSSLFLKPDGKILAVTETVVTIPSWIRPSPKISIVRPPLRYPVRSSRRPPPWSVVAASIRRSSMPP